MTTRALALAIGLILAAAVAGYAWGRYATPAKVVTNTVVEIQTRTEWKDRIVEKVVQGPVRTVTHTVERPVACIPGETTPSIETTTTVDAGPVVTTSDTTQEGTQASATMAQTTTTVTQEQPRWLLQAGIASGTDIRPAYNVGASYRLLGPLLAGAAYHVTDKRLELRASFTF